MSEQPVMDTISPKGHASTRYLCLAFGVLLLTDWIAMGSGANRATIYASQEDSKAPAIAIVLGKPVFEADVHPAKDDDSKLRDHWAIAPLIVAPLVAKYIKDNRLEATPSEIKDWRLWAASLSDELSDPLPPNEATAFAELAKVTIEGWKFDRALHQRYGGRVGFQQAGLEPVDAYQAWLRDEAKVGHFKIVDSKWRDAFWEYYKPKYHRFIDEPNPFKTPPWKE